MGIRNSRRLNMEGESSSDNDLHNSTQNSNQDTDTGDTDITTILQYLIRSGQVRLLTGSDGYDDTIASEDSDEDNLEPAESPYYDSDPDTEEMEDSEFARDLKLKTEYCKSSSSPRKKSSISKLLQMREVGMNGRECFSKADCCAVTSNYLPNECEIVSSYHHKAFCGTHSQDGNIFLSASQDRCIRVYDTLHGQWKELKKIQARDVGWSVIDTAFSPDGNYLIYSSWSDYIHICNIYGEHETHNALHMLPETHSNFCIFSLTFSHDNTEILGGANDGHLYVFDRDRNERTLKIDAHEDDTNSVAFADSSSQILFSGGDDGLIKVWDRRILKEGSSTPVGVLAGHTDGTTYIDPKGDGRYLISNSKDQSIKLWDIRKFSSQGTIEATRKEVSKQHWDYRWQQVPSSVKKKVKRVPGDSSLMTYRGHSVLHTLIRARFSPQFSTGQRYIYTGCATGAVVIYDVLTGKIVRRLHEHRACVRDVSWHPFESTIISTSWDGTLGKWTYSSKVEYDTDEAESEESDFDSDDDDKPKQRRSDRLKSKKKAQKICERRQRRGLAQRMVIFD